MSAAAGALALASAVPPAAAGATPPSATAPDGAASPFDGLMAGEGDPTTPHSDPLATADAAPADPAAPVAVDAVPPGTPPPVAVPAAPPPMDDPATRSVLNALALRVATEAQAATAPAPTGGLPTPAIAAATSAGVPLSPAAATLAAGPAAPVAAAASANAADATLLAAAAAFGAAKAGSTALRATAMPGTSVAPAGDVAASDGDRAGALDALLSSLEALLPAPHPKPAGAPAAPAAATVSAPMSAPLAGALPLPAAPTVASGTGAAPDAATGLLDAAAADAAIDVGTNPNPAQGAVANVAGPASFAAQVAGAAPHAPARADGGQPPITVPFDSPQWGNELATRVVSLAKEQFSEAEIRVTPDELGPIEVKLRFDGDRVHAQFGAISPEAREALTANLHRLREMLAGEGLNLGQAFVGHHGQDAARRFDGQASRSGGGGEDEDAPLGEVRQTTPLRRGLLDEFA